MTEAMLRRALRVAVATARTALAPDGIDDPEEEVGLLVDALTRVLRGLGVEAETAWELAYEATAAFCFDSDA